LLLTSREIVDGDRVNRAAITVIDCSACNPSEISSRSASDNPNAARGLSLGEIPPTDANSRCTVFGVQRAANAACSNDVPDAISPRTMSRSSRLNLSPIFRRTDIPIPLRSLPENHPPCNDR